MMNILLFGVPVQICDLNIDNESLTSYCYKIKESTQSRIMSNEGGWQSDELNLQDLELLPLIESLKNVIKPYINQCGFKTNLEYKLDNMWININGFKDFNKPHTHPKCLFSGVYYVKTPKNCGDIVLNNPANNLTYDWSHNYKNELTTINSFSWTLPSEKGKMFIFPSWVYHYVMPNLNEKEDRISIAFNIA